MSFSVRNFHGFHIEMLKVHTFGGSTRLTAVRNGKDEAVFVLPITVTSEANN